MADAFPKVELSDASLPEFRKLVAGIVNSECSDAARKVNLSYRMVKAAEDTPDIRLAVYRPSEPNHTLPVILQMHGGGFVAGGIDGLEARHRELVATLQCCLVAIDYRLAPETPFPGAIEDCYAALGWLVENAAVVGVDPQSIVLMGESAGGGLAAALSLLARDRGEYRPSSQHLIYPMLDDRTAFTTPVQPFAGEFVWTAGSNRFGWGALLGAEAGGADVSPYAAPARSADLAGLPPTFLMTGALDLFANEGIEYSRRLIGAGVPTELHVFPGAFHGFDLAISSHVGRAARVASLASLTRALGLQV